MSPHPTEGTSKVKRWPKEVGPRNGCCWRDRVNGCSFLSGVGSHHVASASRGKKVLSWKSLGVLSKRVVMSDPNTTESMLSWVDEILYN